MASLERPPSKEFVKFDDWIYRLWSYVTAPTSSLAEINHATLANLNSTAFTHLTANQAGSLTIGLSSSLHYHDSDRDRRNHTGTQSSSTISDFSFAVAEEVRLKGYTVATLPPGVQGDRALATDALAPAFLVAVAGGGSVVTPVVYNGVAWVCG